MYQRLLAVFLAFAQPWYAPEEEGETPEEYEERLQTMAQAVQLETDTPGWSHRDLDDLRALVIVLWYEESTFALDVHQGLRGGGNGRALCLGQITRGAVGTQTWRRLTGTDLASTRRCAAATVQVLSYQADRCLGRRGGRLNESQAGRLMAAYRLGHCTTPQRRDLYRARRWTETRKLLEDS